MSSENFRENLRKLEAGTYARLAPISRRKPGRCADCGWEKPVRTITFWESGMPYTVCAECEKCYRKIINWPVREAPEVWARYRARMSR